MIRAVEDREGDREHRGSVTPGMLECEACGRVTVDVERGWRAVHCIDRDDRLVLVVYCAECAAEELDGV